MIANDKLMSINKFYIAQTERYPKGKVHFLTPTPSQHLYLRTSTAESGPEVSPVL